jgi:hypothetical protein
VGGVRRDVCDHAADHAPAASRRRRRGDRVSGPHIHHYNFGIALLAAVGGALLLDLEDVYWAADGRTSVDVAVGTIATGGLYLAAAPFWHSAVREVARTFLPAGRE